MATQPAKKDEKEKKRALPPITLARGTPGTAKFAAGGAGHGAAGGLGALGLGGKIAVALLLSTLGVGAFGVGKMLAPQSDGVARVGPRVGADRAAEARRYAASDTAALPKDQAPAGAASMQVVPMHMGTPSADAAAADAAAQASADATAAPPDAVPNGDAVKADVARAVNSETKKNTFNKKFGELSKQLGGGSGLSGGAGLSGGIGGNFGSKLGGASRIASRTPARPSGSVAKRPSGSSRAFRQLTAANQLSRSGARTGNAEASSTMADQAFSGGHSAGSGITGGGAGSQPIAGEGTGSRSNPTSSTERPNDNGTSAAPTATGKNVSPWAMAAMAGAAALALGVILLMVASNMAKTPATLAQAKMVAAFAAMCGVLAAAMGAVILGMGQKLFGAIMLGGGALIAVLAGKILMTPEASTEAEAGIVESEGLAREPLATDNVDVVQENSLDVDAYNERIGWDGVDGGRSGYSSGM